MRLRGLTGSLPFTPSTKVLPYVPSGNQIPGVGKLAAVLTGLCFELAVFEGPGSQPSLPPTC